MLDSSSEYEYIEPEDLFNIVNIIRDLEYEHEEEIPDYDNERQAIDEYFSLIDRSKTNYYTSVFEKAAFLFININTHYFSNGNKRLAVTSTVYFLDKNGYTPLKLKKVDYKKILRDLFNHSDFNDWDKFNSENFGLYNLAIIIARHNEDRNNVIANDDLKEKVKVYFEKTFTRK